MKTIRWGIIGCGNVTEVKSGPAFQKVENSQLAAVMRRDGRLAEDYAKRHNVEKWTDDADIIINDQDIDAVYIATPPAYHMDYTLKAARAGKAVYVEKPMALNHAQCIMMIEGCRKYNVPLFIAYYRRALPAFIKVKELIEKGAIGEVRFVKTTLYSRPDKNDSNKINPPWRVVPELSGGGKFVDLASHTLDALDFILGPVKKAKGIALNQAKLYKAEDCVSACYEFESGVNGLGIWNFCSFESFDMNEIVGSRGKILFPTFDVKPVILVNENGKQEFNVVNPENIQFNLIKSIVKELNGEGSCPSTGTSGARTSLVMDEILKEYYHG